MSFESSACLAATNVNAGSVQDRALLQEFVAEVSKKICRRKEMTVVKWFTYFSSGGIDCFSDRKIQVCWDTSRMILLLFKQCSNMTM